MDLATLRDLSLLLGLHRDANDGRPDHWHVAVSGCGGLTLIFGVLKVVNFTHGAFYMLGAYFALTIFQYTGSFTLAMLGAGAATAMSGLIFERVFISRVYGANVLMQLLVCYAFVLIFDDMVQASSGAPEFKSMGMPAAFQVPPLFIAGGVVPPYYVLLIGVALASAIVLWLGLDANPDRQDGPRRGAKIPAWCRRWASIPADL